MLASLLARLVPFRTAIAVSVMLALLAGLGVQTVRLDRAHLRGEVQAERVHALQAQIAAQNAGLEAVKAAAEQKQRAAVAAVAAAEKRLAVANARAERIEAAKTPATCQEAIDFLVQDAGSAQ